MCLFHLVYNPANQSFIPPQRMEKITKSHRVVTTGWVRKGLLFLPRLLPKITLLNPRIIEQKATQQDFLTEKKKSVKSTKLAKKQYF